MTIMTGSLATIQPFMHPATQTLASPRRTTSPLETQRTVLCELHVPLTRMATMCGMDVVSLVNRWMVSVITVTLNLHPCKRTSQYVTRASLVASFRRRTRRTTVALAWQSIAHRGRAETTCRLAIAFAIPERRELSPQLLEAQDTPVHALKSSVQRTAQETISPPERASAMRGMLAQ